MNRDEFEMGCRHSARAHYMGGGVMLCTPLGAVRAGGVLMVASATDRGIVPHLMLDGFWESWVSLWLMRELERRRRNGESVRLLNIGANCGYYSLMGAALGASVVAVDPNQAHCVNIRDSAHLSGLHDRLRVVQAACSDYAGEAKLSFMRGHTARGFVQRSAATMASMDAVSKDMAEELVTVTVPAMTADSAMSDANFLFMDTEGHEPFVWYGAKGIRANKGFVAAIEWSPHRYDDPDGFYESVFADGFEFFVIGLDGRESRVTREALMEKEQMVVLRARGNP